jgi:sugar-specific transcriptional regulator TrmB
MYSRYIQNKEIMAQIQTPLATTSLYSALRKLELTDQEARAYILFLSHTSSEITLIAQELGISRPNVYKLISSLENKGLMHSNDKGGRKKAYMVEPPTTVFEKLKEKAVELERLENDVFGVMPDLMALYRQGELPSSVRIYEGREQLDKTFDIVLREAKDHLDFFGSANDFIRFVGWKRQNQFIKDRNERGVSVRVLTLPGSEANTIKMRDQRDRRETRLLKTKDPFVTSFQLFGSKIIIWQPETPLAIVINDEYVATMLRSMFNLLWERSE